jgi:hypothetical protein
MAIIESKLTSRTVFNSFFGPVNVEPGRNPNIHDSLWKNLKKNNPDVQALLQQGVLVEIDDVATDV